MDENNIVIAGYGRRLGAHFVDVLIIVLLIWITNSFGRGNKTLALITMVTQGFAFYLYTLYFHARSGQTPGKRWLGIQVLSINGQQISWRQSFQRNLILFLSSLPWIIGTIITCTQIPDDQFHNLFVDRKAYYLLEESLRPTWYPIFQIVFGIFVISELAAIFVTKKSQCFHDLIGRTIVVLKDSNESQTAETRL